jgi:predicted Zn finger-like uncharacterized protein
MRIDCPSCSSAYDVPDSLITAGRIVRCASCGDEWTPIPAGATPAPEPAQYEPDASPTIETREAPVVAEVPQQSAMARLAAHPAMPQPSTRLRLAWAGSVALLVLAIAAAFTWRHDIVTAWPPSARAYAMFGLAPVTEKP